MEVIEEQPAMAFWRRRVDNANPRFDLGVLVCVEMIDRDLEVDDDLALRQVSADSILFWCLNNHSERSKLIDEVCFKCRS